MGFAVRTDWVVSTVDFMNVQLYNILSRKSTGRGGEYKGSDTRPGHGRPGARSGRAGRGRRGSTGFPPRRN